MQRQRHNLHRRPKEKNRQKTQHTQNRRSKNHGRSLNSHRNLQTHTCLQRSIQHRKPKLRNPIRRLHERRRKTSKHHRRKTTQKITTLIKVGCGVWRYDLWGEGRACENKIFFSKLFHPTSTSFSFSVSLPCLECFESFEPSAVMRQHAHRNARLPVFQYLSEISHRQKPWFSFLVHCFSRFEEFADERQLSGLA